MRVTPHRNSDYNKVPDAEPWNVRSTEKVSLETLIHAFIKEFVHLRYTWKSPLRHALVGVDLLVW